MSDNPIFDRIQGEINENDVVLFMKGSPMMPQCGFSAAVTHLLSTLQVKFKGVDVLQDMEVREGIKQFSNWPTIPQLFVNGELIGGCDIAMELHNNGELKNIFEGANK